MVMVTITENDTASSSIMLSVDPASVDENAGATTVELSVTAATAAEDYTATGATLNDPGEGPLNALPRILAGA